VKTILEETWDGHGAETWGLPMGDSPIAGWLMENQQQKMDDN